MAELELQISKDEAIKLLDTNMKEFFDIGKKIKEMTDKQNSLKAEITSLVKKFFTTENDCAYKNSEYYARVSKTTRPNLNKDLVEKMLKVVVTNECYTITTYDTLKVDVVSNYKEPKKKVDNKKVVMESEKKSEPKQENKVDFDINL